MDGIRLGSIAFTVADAAAGAHALPVARADDRASAEGILVLDGALEDVGDDLHVAMRVRREALAAGDAVLVDDAQGSKTHVVAVVIFAERKRVISIEPAEVEVAAFGSFASGDHNESSLLLII